MFSLLILNRLWFFDFFVFLVVIISLYIAFREKEWGGSLLFTAKVVLVLIFQILLVINLESRRTREVKEINWIEVFGTFLAFPLFYSHFYSLYFYLLYFYLLHFYNSPPIYLRGDSYDRKVGFMLPRPIPVQGRK